MTRRGAVNFTLGLILFLPLIQACGAGEVTSDTTPSPGEIIPFSKVSVTPASGEISQGENFDRTVDIEGADMTFFTAFDMTYDPNIVEFISAGEGGFLNRNGADQTSFHAALQNGNAGRLTVGLTRLGQTGNVSGNGRLVTLTFRALNPGTTILSFSSPLGMTNSEGQSNPVDSWEGGIVTVQ